MGFSLTRYEDSDGTLILRDPWVLIVIIILWIALAVTFWSKEIKRRRQALQLRLQEGTSRRTLAPFDDEEKSVCHVLTQDKKELPPSRFIYVFETSTSESRTKRQRRWEDFRDRRFESIPPDPKAFALTFQHQYRTTSRLNIYWSMQKGAFVRSARFVAVVGVFAASITYWTRTSQAVAEYTHATFFTEEAVMGNLKAAHEVQKLLLPLASFVLALFINLKLTWFQGVISSAWGIQGQMNDMAMTLGALLANRSDEEGMLRVKYRIYRYLNLVHLELYSKIDAKLDVVSCQDCVDCRLLTEQEAMLLSRAPVRRNMLLLWLGNIFRELADQKAISEHQLRRLLDSLQKLRALMDGLIKELTRVAPISYMQLMQLMIDIAMLLSPPGLVYSLATNRESVTVYLWPAFGSMLIAMFYQGGMRLITVMERPFGSDLDDLHTDWLLLSSERALFGYLTDVCPKEEDYRLSVVDVETPDITDVKDQSQQAAARKPPAGGGAKQDAWALSQVVPHQPSGPQLP